MESKCLCCGGELYVETPEEDDDAVYAFYDCQECFFSCEINDLPRIAAAMELARAEVALATTVKEVDDPSIIAGAMSAVCEARDKVIKVFGGE